MSKLIPIACLALPGTAGYASIAPSANATAFRTLTASGIRYEMKM